MSREQDMKRIFSKGMDDPKKRRAVLTQDVTGKFGMVWRKGTEVLAWRSAVLGALLCIERMRWKKPWVPLMNQMAFVPRAAVEFRAVKNNQQPKGKT